MNRLLNPLWTRVLQPAKSFLFLYKKRHHHTVKRIRCLRENGFRELEVPKGSLHHASNSFIENSDSCEGWKCKRMDLNFHSPSSKSPLLIQPHTPAVTIWALTFNHFNGYLISEPPSVEPTRGTHGELPNPPSFRPIKYIYHLVESSWREHGATFSSEICHSDLLFKTQSPPFSEQLNNPWYVKTSVKALNNIRAISVQGQFLLRNRWRHWKWKKIQTKKLWPWPMAASRLYVAQNICVHIYIYMLIMCICLFRF